MMESGSSFSTEMEEKAYPYPCCPAAGCGLRGSLFRVDTIYFYEGTANHAIINNVQAEGLFWCARRSY